MRATESLLQALENGPSLERPTLFDYWLMPISQALETTSETASKPLAELTVPDLIAWAAVLGYSALTGYILGKIAVNIAGVALGGPRRS